MVAISHQANTLLLETQPPRPWGRGCDGDARRLGGQGRLPLRARPAHGAPSASPHTSLPGGRTSSCTLGHVCGASPQLSHLQHILSLQKSPLLTGLSLSLLLAFALLLATCLPFLPLLPPHLSPHLPSEEGEGKHVTELSEGKFRRFAGRSSRCPGLGMTSHSELALAGWGTALLADQERLASWSPPLVMSRHLRCCLMPN